METTKVAKHNKKRNVGLIHEQLVRYVASSLVANDKKAAEKAIQIVAKHFRKGTELYREFRLFNALVNVPVGSRSLAERILVESKNAATGHNPQKLSQEKSLLIKDINTQLAESRRFYDIKIDNYRLYATVQTVLNEWRGGDALDLTSRAKYEEDLVEWLSRSAATVQEESIQADPLVRKLMFQKFEEKYRDKLSETQKRVLETSILGNDQDFAEIIKETKKNALSALDSYSKSCDNKILRESLGGVRERIVDLPEQKSDEVVAKTLHLIHLIEEMNSDER